MNWRFLFTVCMVSILLTGGLVGAEHETIYTRVGQWDVERSKWELFLEDFEKYEQPLLDKLLREGVITEYGIDTNMVHSPDGYTHSTWFSARSLAGLEQVLDAFEAANESLGKEESEQRTAAFAGALRKHNDIILRSVMIQSRAVRTDKGYILGTSGLAQPGKGREFRRIWSQYIKPVFDQMLSDGTITGYGMDVEQIHTTNPGMHSVWWVVPSSEGLDRVEAAFDAFFDDLPEGEQDAIDAAFRSVSVEGSHEDSMSKLLHYASSGYGGSGN